MKMALPKFAVFCIALALSAGAGLHCATAAPADFDGVWVPDVKDQHRQEAQNVPPWKPEIVPQIQRLIAEENAGRPFLVLSHCLPHGMPTWMLISHNAFEWLTTPGRVTMLGEVDGNRMRRIYTDGRVLPKDPDLTLHGYSIGHWDGDALVVDTVGFNDRSWLGGLGGGPVPHTEMLHMTERYRRVDFGHMEATIAFEDPGTFVKPFHMNVKLNLAPREEVMEYVCENNRPEHLVGN